MSINRKLGDLANVLDDGTEGQVLSFNASGVIAASDIAAGASVYDSAALLPLSGLSAGDMAYVTGTNRFYISNGTGWYSVSLINTNPSITSVQDSAGGTTPFTLTTDGTATVITVTASDPEEVPLTYNYSVTSGSLTNGGGTTATVTQADNVFTVTPSTTEAYAGTFELTFTASDGINQGTSANSFTLSFITIITNSNYTTLLATATGTSDNNNITDASTNNHLITVNGDAYAGTFSPYRSGGYSTYFDGTGDYIDTNSAINLSSGGCIEGWVYITSATNYAFFIASTQGAPNYPRWYVGHSNATDWRCSPGDSTDNNITSYDLITNQWNHFVLSNDGSRSRLFANGVLIFTKSVTPVNENLTFTLSKYGSSAQYFMTGNLFDVRVNTSIPTEYQTSSTTVGASIFTPPTEPLSSSGSALHICHLPYLADGSSNTYTLTPTGDVSTKPFSPYDYLEYSATDHGGSLYFNGTNSAVEIADNDDFDFGTGDLTIECWVYPEVTSNSYPGFLGTSAGWGSIAASGFRFDNLGDSKFQMSWYGPGDPFLETQSTYKHNQWYHFVVTRTGGSTWRMFVNGILEDTGTNSTAYDISIGGNNLQVGGKTWDGGNGWFKGNVADLRLTKGSVVSEYQTTSTTVGTKIFTPRTSPISSSGSELHIKGTDASIIDKSQGANLKLVGNTTGSTTQVKFASSKSMYFDGIDDHIVGPTVSDLNIGTGDFTAECWIYETTLNTNKGIWDGRSTGLTTDGFTFTRINTDAFRIWSGSALITTDPVTIQNTWVHCAVVRYNGTLTIYINGSSSGTPVSNSTNFSNSGTFIIGAGRHGTDATPTAFITGYIQDLRVSNYAHYTANFTPPTASLEG